jgi:hypothetical protein
MAPLLLRWLMSTEESDLLREEIDELMMALPDRIDADPDGLDAGLARLVLTLVEFLRQVLEHQAVRRLDSGTLTDEEEERLGLAFLRLRDRMTEMREALGVAEEDLNLDLGPLGRLL